MANAPACRALSKGIGRALVAVLSSLAPVLLGTGCGGNGNRPGLDASLDRATEASSSSPDGARDGTIENREGEGGRGPDGPPAEVGNDGAGGAPAGDGGGDAADATGHPDAGADASSTGDGAGDGSPADRSDAALTPDLGPGCPVDCRHLPHVRADAGGECQGGVCVLPEAPCEPGWGHCDGNPNDGCENPLNSVDYCGVCDNRCDGFDAECVLLAGKYGCVRHCDPPFPDACGSACVDLQSDIENCGSCLHSCYVGNADVGCEHGQCVVLGCPSNYVDCGPGATGCQTLLGTAENCGGCGDQACALTNTLFTCKDGPSCQGAVCAPGFANCEATSADCETAFATPASSTCLPRYLDSIPIPTQRFDSVATGIAPDGSYFLAGTFSQSVDFDPAPATRDIRTASGDSAGFVTKFRADGSYAWTAVLGGRGSVGLGGLAVTPAGGVVVTGAFNDSIDLDPSDASDLRLTATINQRDPYVVELSAAGASVWGATFTGSASAADGAGTAVAVDATGAVFATGRFTGTVDFDPGPGAAPATAPAEEPYLVKLTATGTLDSLRLIDDCTAGLNALAVASDGNLWATGGAVTGSGCAASDDRRLPPGIAALLILQYGGAAGTPPRRWLLGGSQSSIGYALAPGSAGSMYIGGEANGPIDYDPGPGVGRHSLSVSGGGFILKLDATGGYLWARVLDRQPIRALAAAPDGGVAGAGGGFGIFVTRLGADGAGAWSLVIGGTYSLVPPALAAGAGRLALAGFNSNANDYDPGPLADLINGDVSVVSRLQF